MTYGSSFLNNYFYSLMYINLYKYMLFIEVQLLPHIIN